MKSAADVKDIAAQRVVETAAGDGRMSLDGTEESSELERQEIANAIQEQLGDDFTDYVQMQLDVAKMTRDPKEIETLFDRDRFDSDPGYQSAIGNAIEDQLSLKRIEGEEAVDFEKEKHLHRICDSNDDKIGNRIKARNV